MYFYMHKKNYVLWHDYVRNLSGFNYQNLSALNTNMLAVNFKDLMLKGFSIENVWEFFQALYLPSGGYYRGTFSLVVCSIWRASWWYNFLS